MLNLKDIMENNPIAGKTGAELDAINEKYMPLQQTLRHALIMAAQHGDNPGVGLASALHGMSSMALLLDSAEAAGYIIALAEGLKHAGPEALLHGELHLGGMFKKDEVPAEIKERFGLTDKDLAEGSGVTIRQEGNVIDASNAFGKGRAERSDYEGGGMGFKIPPRDKLH